MDFNFKTLTCLMILILLHKEAAGKIKKADDSLPLDVYGSLVDAKYPFVIITGCKNDEEFLCKKDEEFRRVSSSDETVAEFGIITPGDAKIDHFTYKQNIKFGEKDIEEDMLEMEFIKSPRDTGSQSDRIYIKLWGNFQELDVPEGERGTQTISINGLDKNEEVVALWKVEIDIEVVEEED